VFGDKLEGRKVPDPDNVLVRGNAPADSGQQLAVGAEGGALDRILVPFQRR